MIPGKPHALKRGLVVAMGFFHFFYCSGCSGTEVPCQRSSHIPIHLAVGTFDPLSESGPIALPKELTLERYPEGEAGYYILQFKGPVLEKWKKRVVSAGARIFDYIPRFAFIVKMDHRSREAVRAMESIRWLGIYQPGYRIAPDLLASISEKGDGPMDVMVSVFKGEDVSGLASEIDRLGGETLEISEGNEKIRVKISLKRVTDLSRLTGVKWIERVPEFRIFPSIRGRSEE